MKKARIFNIADRQSGIYSAPALIVTTATIERGFANSNSWQGGDAEPLAMNAAQGTCTLQIV